MDKTLTEQEIALLRRKLDLLLRTGQLLVESAADTNRVVRNLNRVAAYLGLPEEKLHIDVSYTMLVVNERRPAFVLQIPEMRKAWHQHDCHFRNQQTVLAGY